MPLISIWNFLVQMWHLYTIMPLTKCVMTLCKKKILIQFSLRLTFALDIIADLQPFCNIICKIFHESLKSQKLWPKFEGELLILKYDIWDQSSALSLPNFVYSYLGWKKKILLCAMRVKVKTSQITRTSLLLGH